MNSCYYHNIVKRKTLMEKEGHNNKENGESSIDEFIANKKSEELFLDFKRSEGADRGHL